ncbi:hypothetical protein AB0K18_27935 [Nonomuraea sp. NPDC049421]|uniref:hypothetical protein n=1 Tax=Nonomuraea sp. NPDC049421 TaxID=3155275 RepID=UPI003416FBCE
MPHPSQAPKQPPRKSSKIVPLAVLGVLSVMVVGYCAAVDDDEEVTADCVLLGSPNGSGDFPATPTPTPTSTPTASPTATDSATPTATESPTTSPTPTDSPAATSTSSDGSYQVVDDSYCDDDSRSSSTGHHYGGSHGAYVWYYGGHRVGTRVRGGTTLKPSDVNISSRSGKSIQRGGFGRGWSGGS